MDTSEIWIERAHRVGDKKSGQERHIAVQFNSYKNKLDILRNCKKLKGFGSLRKGKEKWKEILKNQKNGQISYNIKL